MTTPPPRGKLVKDSVIAIGDVYLARWSFIRLNTDAIGIFKGTMMRALICLLLVLFEIVWNLAWVVILICLPFVILFWIFD